MIYCILLWLDMLLLLQLCISYGVILIMGASGTSSMSDWHILYWMWEQVNNTESNRGRDDKWYKSLILFTLCVDHQIRDKRNEKQPKFIHRMTADSLFKLLSGVCLTTMTLVYSKCAMLVAYTVKYEADVKTDTSLILLCEVCIMQIPHQYSNWIRPQWDSTPVPSKPKQYKWNSLQNRIWQILQLMNKFLPFGCHMDLR